MKTITEKPNYFSQNTAISKNGLEQHDFPAVNKADIIANWNNYKWAGWHSPDWEQKGRPTRDDAYLRSTILSHFPVNTTRISLKELDENWHNSEWWQEDINNTVYIMDNMYVKKSVKAYNGIYSNWLTRLVQFVNTYRCEKKVKDSFGFIWNEDEHTYIHSGIATDEENKPDFIAQNRATVELKLVENEASITNFYFDNLRTNFEQTKKDDFHGADYAMFATKTTPSKIYTVKLDSPDSLNLKDVQTLDIPLIPTEKGKILNRADNPAVPLCLLYGLTPRWQKKVK